MSRARLAPVLLLLALFSSSHEARTADTQDGYAGSKACEGCHTYIYNQWRGTRHSFSVKTPAEARSAGFPLPRPRQGGGELTIRSWDDVAYVIGGRQRIAYADAAGRVQDTSYHHRTGGWDAFPTKPMSVCGPCHYTGFGVGPEHSDNPVLPGRWVERNIGCEACHGPGARHVESLEKADIQADPSSRVCGQCHTAVGKVLPKGELHATHDLVQGWNQDPHVTGVRWNSDNAFCARCHAPYQGHIPEAGEGAARRVFSETKRNITCIGCHNPHQLTNANYGPDNVLLTPPLPIPWHTHEGHDADFTTTDYKAWDSTDEVCERCHRGADRVDLDHANATCQDCHNQFNRNHGRESRRLHDANHPALSCRGCHEDADHLMAVLYRDPDFLAPKHIHNLRTLPARARTKYGFRYAELIRPGALATNVSIQETAAAVAEQNPNGDLPNQPTVIRQTGSAHHEALRELLSAPVHRRLAGDETVSAKQRALSEAPDSVGRYLDLADVYAGQGEFSAAREIIAHGLALDASRLLLELPFGRDADRSDMGETAEARARTLLPPSALPGEEALRAWLQGYLEMTEGRFADAARTLASVQAGSTERVSLRFHLALAELGQGRYREALVAIKANLRANPEHRASKVGLGFVHLARRRSKPAIEALTRAIADHPGDAAALYILGRAYLTGRDMANAVQAYRAAVDADPNFLLARFDMARAYGFGGRPDAATRVYREIVRRQPGLFQARFELANVLKLLSDRLAYQLQSARETSPPTDISVARWRDRLSGWEREVEKFRDLALSELAIAASVRPSAIEVIRQVAEIYRQSGRLSEAERFYRWLARRQPEWWLYRYRLGVVQIRQGRDAEAIETLTRALTMAPTDGDTFLALGLAQIRAGRLDAAIDTFERGRIYEPFNPALYTNLGAAYARRGNLEHASAALERSLELASFPLPRVHLTHTNLAIVRIRQGRPEAAAQSLRRALHSFSQYAYARELLDRLNAGEHLHEADSPPDVVFNDLLERFGEVTTVAFAND